MSPRPFRTTVLITGASSGLGAEMARQFAANGHDLALAARRRERLEELRAEIGERHPAVRVQIRTLDVLDDEQVFEVFRGFRDDFGSIDRVIVNAGIGNGAKLGTGAHAENKATALTNFIGALAQADAALEIFRDQNAGHLVLISSVSAARGLPGSMATYAASKAAVAHLGEGLRVELHGTPIAVTVLYPGYIKTEMSGAGNYPFMVDAETGVRAMVEVIEKEKASAYVPALPWAPMSAVMKLAPTPVLKKMV